MPVVRDHSELTKRGQALAALEGRRPGRPVDSGKVSDQQIRMVLHLGTAEAARLLGLSRRQYQRRRNKLLDRLP